MHLVTSGDSWSKGEWDIINNQHNVSHSGINYYFKNDGHDVVNLHEFSNKASIKKLKSYLENNFPDVIFYFFTDPFRDFSDPSNSSIFHGINEKLKNVEDFNNLHKFLINSTLSDLDKLNKKIYVLGGCQKLTKEKYENIEILIESISELVCPEFKHPDFWDSGWTSYLDFKNLNRQFFYFIEKQHKLQWSMESKDFEEMFMPDGFHPNRYAHLKLYNYLKENVNEFK
jgi:hypothetical protein